MGEQLIINNKLERDFLNAVFENAGALVMVLDRDGRICRFNKACEMLSGYAEAEAMGQICWEFLLPPEIADKVRIECFEALAHHPEKLVGETTNQWLCKDGRRPLLKWSNTLILDEYGQTEYLIALGTDITEQKQIGEQNIRLTEKLDLATSTSKTGIWDWDINNNNLIWDDHTFELYGVDKNNFNGTYQAWESGVHPDDLQQAKEAVERALLNEEPYDVEFRICRPNGEIRYTKAVAHVMRDTQGQPVRMLGINTDISDCKEIEIELDEHRHNLEGLVKQRTFELELSLREKEVLLQEVHHRVKNNLAMVSAFIRLKKGQTDDKPAIEALESCDMRVQAMAMAHKKLYQSSNLASIDMQSLFRELSSAIYTEGEQGRITIKINAQDILLGMEIATPCTMIFNELLSNAVKHAFPDDQAGKIEITMQKNGQDNYQLEFSDNGCGLPPTLDINQSDTLGLQLVNIFVQQMNGSLTLDQQDGTRYNIRFPV
jgi:PAS domain S-box-containing protein